MKNYICEGKKIETTAAADIASGAVVKTGSLITVAGHAAKTGEKLVSSRSGVYELAKKADDVVVQGAPLYWDPANSHFTVTAGALVLGGHAYEAAAGAVAVVKVILLG